MDEMIDSMIIECNNAVKNAMTGNLIAWCKTMVDITRSLEDLRCQVNNQIDKRDQKIEVLKQQIKELEKDGAE